MILEKIPEDPDIVLAWNQLVFKMERPEVFFSHQWALAASRAFSDLHPLIFLVYDSGRLAGVAAMATNRASPGTVFFLTASTADYCDIVSEPQNRKEVLDAVLDELNKVSTQDLILANVPAESRTLQAISPIARSRGFHFHHRPAYECGIISLGDQKHRHAILQSVIRKERERRGLKKLGQLGPIRLAHLSVEQVESGLEPIFRAPISRFLAANRLSPLIHHERRFFLEELGRLMGLAGWLKISQLEAGGRPIAWNYGFRFSDSWFWYLPTFRVQFEDSSPGSCLLRLIIEQACADTSVNRLDLGLGDESYKRRFSNAASSTSYVQLSKSTPRHIAVVGRYRLAALAETFPTMGKRLRDGREVFRRVQSRIRSGGAIATATHTFKRARTLIRSMSEVAFFEAPKIKMSENDSRALRPLTWDEIASAAIDNAGDDQTLLYLIRSAQRLRKGIATSYLLRETGPHACHFLWADLYNGFYLSEIDSRLESVDSQAMMIFDCWTPVSQRGHGHYAKALRLIAAYFQQQQKAVWIFSAVKNESSISGILKAGFVYSFSLARSKTLWSSRLSRSTSDIGSIKDLTSNHRSIVLR
jgi:CelD/BcsL family acetyltransferase involved in cellulose biosynthesis